MQTVNSRVDVGELSTSPERATKLTRALLACGVVAGPLYVVVGLSQALTRNGFDLTRFPPSGRAAGRCTQLRPE